MKFTTDRRLELIVIVCANILIAAVFGAKILSGESSYITGGDAFSQSYMWLSKVFHAASNNQLVLWDFSTSSGVSFIGEQQTAPLYPLSWIFGKLAYDVMPQAYDQFLLAHYAIAAIGVSILLRALKADIIASIAGAVIFSYTGSFAERISGQPNLFCSLAYVPYMALGIFLVTTKTEKIPKAAGFIICAAAVAFSALAGHAYAIAVGMTCAMCLSGFYLLALGNTKTSSIFRPVFWSSIIVAFSSLLALPQVISTQEYLRLSYKWNFLGHTKFPHVTQLAEYKHYSLNFSDLISFFGPDAHLQDGGTLFFTLTGFVLVCLLPLTSRYLAPSQRKSVRAGLFTLLLTLVFAFGWVYTLIPFLNQVRSPSRWLFGSGLSFAILASLSLCGLKGLLERKTTLDSRILTYIPFIFTALISLEAYKFIHAKVERPRWDRNSTTAALKTPVTHALFNEIGKHPLIYRYYASRDVIQTNLGNINFSLATEGYRSTRTVEYHDYFDYSPLGKHIRNLGVKWWVSEKPIEGMKIVWQDDHYVINELIDPLPVLWAIGASGNQSSVAVKNVDWQENRVIFDLDKPVTGKIIFAQTYFPGFRANADGTSYVVEPHDSLMSIDVLTPSRRLTFEYLPSWWWWSSAIAATAWLLLISSAVLVFSRLLISPKPSS